MTSPLDLARRYTGLDLGGRKHLERLMATWSLLADLSFSDLLLYVPLDEVAMAGAGEDWPAEPGGNGSAATGPHFVVLGQIRPTTSQTLLDLDLVGQVVAGSEVELIVQAWRQGVVTRGVERDPLPVGLGEVQCIPVRWRGEVLAVVRRTWSPGGRRRGNLELTYLDLFDRFASMMADGIFPFVADDAAIEEAPRVGDGVIIVDERSRVTFMSPNGVSALHRMGVVSAILGSTLSSLGVDTAVFERAVASRLPAIEEVERHGEVIVLFRCIPLIAAGEVTGTLLLVRDVTDLRRRDRLLLSKDAAIREVHHRVKNNLQTISSLLRLQARRLEAGSARGALVEAERRVRSIALVHELLSRESGDQVPFDEIVHSLVRMAKESNVSGRPLALRVDGDVGKVPTDIATPLAVVLAELLQNAVEHGFGGRLAPAVPPPPASFGEGSRDPARVEVVFRHDADGLRVEVRDNGCGLPDGFDPETSAHLGLAIVRDLVRTQLEGTIDFSSDRGTVVRLAIPLGPRRG